MATGSSTLVTVDSDGGLVLGTLAGDQASFAALYDRFATRIHDFHLAVLRDPRPAREATHQTFQRAVADLNHLGDPGQLRLWLYTHAYRLPATRRREPSGRRSLLTGGEQSLDDPGALLWTAPAELNRLDRTLLTLRLRHGLDDTELASVVGVSATRVRKRLVGLTRLVPPTAPLTESLVAPPRALRHRVLGETALITAHQGLPRPRTRAAWISTAALVLIVLTGAALLVHRSLERRPVVAVRFGPASDLTLSTTVIDMGAVASTATVTLANTGQHELTWRAVPGDPWLRVQPSTGSLAGGGSQQLIVTVDRNALPEGDGRGQLEVTSLGDQGRGVVAVALREEHPPTILGPRAGDPRIGGFDCPTSTEITATVRDESGPVHVVLVGPGQQSQIMQARGDTYSGRLGSGSGENILWRIVATDARNNTAVSPTQVIVHGDCATRPAPVRPATPSAVPAPPPVLPTEPPELPPPSPIDGSNPTDPANPPTETPGAGTTNDTPAGTPDGTEGEASSGGTPFGGDPANGG